MDNIYILARKFSYIVLYKTAYKKVVEMNTKRRQCRNNPDLFCLICGEYMMAKYRFIVRGFTNKAYEAYFGMKLWDQDKSWAPIRCANIVQKLCFFGPKASQFDAVSGSYGIS